MIAEYACSFSVQGLEQEPLKYLEPKPKIKKNYEDKNLIGTIIFKIREPKLNRDL